MANYVITSNGELYHYGVKGMKWGVRRAIGKKARSYAKDYYDSEKTNKRIKRIDSTVKAIESMRNKTDKFAGTSDKAIKMLERGKRNLQSVEKKLQLSMREKMSTLSDKDIAQGKRAVKAARTATSVANLVLPTAVGMGVSQLFNVSAFAVRTVYSSITLTGNASRYLDVYKYIT